MNITVLFFGITTDIVGTNSIAQSLNENATVKDLKSKLISSYSGLKHLDEFAVAVNETYAEDKLKLNDNDVVAIIPPVSGG